MTLQCVQPQCTFNGLVSRWDNIVLNVYPDCTCCAHVWAFLFNGITCVFSSSARAVHPCLMQLSGPMVDRLFVPVFDATFWSNGWQTVCTRVWYNFLVLAKDRLIVLLVWCNFLVLTKDRLIVLLCLMIVLLHSAGLRATKREICLIQLCGANNRQTN